MVICASPSYLAKHGVPKSVEDLQGHTGIVYGRAGQTAPWPVRDASGNIREPRIESRLRFDDLQAIADAAVSGAGLAWLPCWLVAPHVRANELMLVIDSQRVLATDIHAVWPQARHLSAKVRVAIDALAAEIPAMIAYPDRERGTGEGTPATALSARK
jgi:DNA-binding transcriptional LysR family regulator